MIRINLLPSAHRRRRTSNPLPLVIAGFCTIFVVVGGGLFAWETYSISKLQAEEQSLQQILVDYGKQKGRVDELKAKLAEVQRQLGIKTEIMRSALDVPWLVDEVSAFTPADVQLESLGFSTEVNSSTGQPISNRIGTVNLSVSTTSYSSAANALVSYEAAPSLENVETSSVSKSEGKVTFSISGALVARGGDGSGASTDK